MLLVMKFRFLVMMGSGLSVVLMVLNSVMLGLVFYLFCLVFGLLLGIL